jgi:hypothetical protein
MTPTDAMIEAGVCGNEYPSMDTTAPKNYVAHLHRNGISP